MIWLIFSCIMLYLAITLWWATSLMRDVEANRKYPRITAVASFIVAMFWPIFCVIRFILQFISPEVE